eukprot:1151900-Pelagomonas_calceolata.AAC.1
MDFASCQQFQLALGGFRGGGAGHMAVESRKNRVELSRSMAGNPPGPHSLFPAFSLFRSGPFGETLPSLQSGPFHNARGLFGIDFVFCFFLLACKFFQGALRMIAAQHPSIP